MAHSISALAAQDKTSLWLDYYDYAGDLLGQGRIPWLDAAAFGALQGKAQALLPSAVIHLPVEPVAAALIAQDPELLQQMRARPRSGFPLRCLLEQPALRRAVTELLQPLRASNPQRPLALLLPSPRRWLALTHELARGEPLPASAMGADEIETASMYLADFLRSYAESGIDAIVLQECGGCGPRSAQELAWYAPVINKVQHYRWELGLLDAAPAASLPNGGGLSFYIVPEPSADAIAGRLLAPSFWNGDAPPARPDTRLLYAAVPRGAVPEQVLSRLAALN